MLYATSTLLHHVSYKLSLSLWLQCYDSNLDSKLVLESSALFQVHPSITSTIKFVAVREMKRRERSHVLYKLKSFEEIIKFWKPTLKRYIFGGQMCLAVGYEKKEYRIFFWSQLS